MINSDQLQQAIRMYNSGVSGTKVAKFLGLCPNPTYDLLRENGVEIRSRGRPPRNGTGPRRRKGTLEEIVEMVKSGRSLRDIANECNTGWQNISHLLIRNGYRPSEMERLPRPPSPPTTKQVEIAELYRQGVMPVEIGRRYGVSTAVVDLARKKCNIPVHPVGFFFKGEEYYRRNHIVAERYARGDKVDEIAAELGIQATQIPRILRRQGLKPTRMPTAGRWGPRSAEAKAVSAKTAQNKNPHVQNEDLIKTVVELRQHKMSHRAIAEVCSVSHGTVQRILAKIVDGSVSPY